MAKTPKLSIAFLVADADRRDAWASRAARRVAASMSAGRVAAAWR
jgi:hypothetical protein